MMRVLLSLLFIFFAYQHVQAQTPGLGIYPATIIANAGGNATVLSSVPPSNATSVMVYTSGRFKGLLSIVPATGVVTATNAHPAGSYAITVKALNGENAATSSFNLTVNNPGCSQGLFSGSGTVGVGSLPYGIAIGDFNNDGKQDLATANYGLNTVSIRLGNGSGGFGGTSNINVGSGPQAIAIGDFNNDGRQDMAVSNFISSNVSILLGNGTGGFTSSGLITLVAGSYPYSLAIGDFNGDGKNDLVTSNYSNNTASILLGDGTGGFNVTTHVNVGNGPRSVAVGDFNGDGKPDIATANYLAGTVSIRLGNGLGGFTGTANITVGSNPHSVTLGDFNGDGKKDIATANINSSSVSIRLGDGLGNFTGTTVVSVDTNPRSVVTGDFNGDGKQDIATANFSVNTVSVRLGDGAGNFTGHTNVTVGDNPYSLAIGDFNSDGLQDIVTANAGSSNVSICLGTVNDINVLGNDIIIADGNINPSLADHTDFGNVTNNFTRIFTIQNPGPVSLTISNILFTGTNAALFNTGNTSFPIIIPAGGFTAIPVTFIPTSTGFKTAVINIINNHCEKGVYDFVLQGTGVTQVTTLGNYPASTVSSAGGNLRVTPDDFPVNSETITAYTSTRFKGLLQVSPVTGVVTITNAHPAGIYTIYVTSSGVSTITNSFTLTVNNTSCSQGLFTLNGNLTASPGVQSIAIGDFNSDGIQDLATGNNNNSLSIRLGIASGGFNGNTTVNLGGIPQSIVVGDFNGDGKQDIATVNSGSIGVSVRLGDGSGGFSGTGNFVVGANPVYLAIGDFNGDGKQDLATANFAGNSVSILLGDGLGSFVTAPALLVENSPRSIAVGDFNADGKQDLAIGLQNVSMVAIYSGDGLGGFTSTSNVSVDGNPYSITIGDFNTDGIQDFATANFNTNNVSIRLGNGTGNFIAFTEVLVGNGPMSIAVGDFNGDGKQDLVTTNKNGNNASIRFGNGAGYFAGTGVVTTGNSPVTLAIGDFNNDGRQDFVTANSGTGDISIRQSGINDMVVRGNNITIEDGNLSASAADHTDFGNVNGNQIRTFTIQNTGSVNLLISSISITGTNSNLFAFGNIGLPVNLSPGAATTFTVSFIPTSAGLKTATVNIFNDHCTKSIYDFTIQGMGEVLVPTLGIYPATSIPTAGGNITVTPASSPANAQNITAFASRGFKGSLLVNTSTGVVSIINAHPAGTYTITVKAYGISTATSSFILTVNNAACSQGLFSSLVNVAVGANPFSVAIGDFNGDGRQDLATSNYSSNTVSIKLGDGSGGFSGSVNVSVGSQPFSVAVGDFNGDGKLDLVTASHNSSSVSVRLGDGLGNFSGNTEVPVGNMPTLVRVGDFNGDGKPDLAVALIGSNSISIRLGDGAGNFSGNTEVPVGSVVFSMVIGDFNGDGKQDIASANYNVSTVSVLLGNGLGGFTLNSEVYVGLNPYSISIGDFNGNGKQDIATADYNNNTVSVCLGDGTGNFLLTTSIPVGNGPGSVAVGDFNGDGKQDIVTANYLSNNLSVCYGNGLGNFSAAMSLPVGSGPGSVGIGDFNGDGKQDLAVVNSNSNNISVRLGIGNEINVQGNSINIADGETTTSINNLTNFGTSNNVTNIFSIQNTGTVNLTVSSIYVTGMHAPLFTLNGISLPVVIPAGGATTFSVRFMPLNAGIKTATINIINDDCDEGHYDFAVQGTYNCPQTLVNFSGLPAAICINAAAVTLTGSQTQGVVFSGSGITNAGNGTAIFDPNTAGTGQHVISYIYTDGLGCTHSTSQTVMVNALPVVGFNGLATAYYITDAPVTLTGSPSANGVFTGPGITNEGNGTAIFDPSISGTGTHGITYTYADMNGCSNSYSQAVTVNNLITLNLKLYLQGYYTGDGWMQPVLNNQDVLNSLATETDSIAIELHDPASYALVDSKMAVLLTDGTVSTLFTQPAGNYYIAIRHRNTVQTWSADPVACFATAPVYDFSTAASKAFADNQAEVEPGVWAFYTGDMNQDEFIDGNDFPAYDTDSFDGVNTAYTSTDMNGDGFVDGNDFPVYDVNSFNGVSSIHP